MGCRWAGVGRIRPRVRRHLEEVIRLVFENDEIVLLSNLVDLPSSFSALRGARGVLARGNSVYEKGLRPTSRFLIPIRDDFIERSREHPTLVHRHGSDFDPHRCRRLHGRRERILLAQHPFPGTRQHPKDEIPRRGRSNGHGTAPIPIRRVVHDFGVLDDPSQQLRGSVTLAVIERGGNVQSGFLQGHVVFSGADHIERVRVVDFVQFRDFHVDLVEGEILARG